MAVKCLSNEKSTGADEIAIELFKDSPEAIQELHNIILLIWEKEELLELPQTIGNWYHKADCFAW